MAWLLRLAAPMLAEERYPASPRLDADTELLLAGLASDTDLARLVRRVCSDRLPWVVLSSVALDAWQRRDPEGWASVAEWLATRSIRILLV